jgi:drug/metabolite transporter (DMT)-like permease
MTETADHTRRNGTLLVLLAALCLSFAPTLIKVGLTAEASPLPLLAWRLGLAAALLWLLLPLARPGIGRMDRPGLASALIAAAANAGGLLCFYLALTRLDVAIATMIFALFPAFALLLLTLRGEPLTRHRLLRLALALVGVYLLLAPAGDVDLVGVALALTTSFLYALHLVLLQWRLSGYPSTQVALYVVSFMALLIGVIYLGRFESVSFTPAAWFVILITGIVSTALARLAMFAGIQRIGSGQTALLGPLELLLAITWSVLFLGERLAPLQFLGGALILLSAALAAPRWQRWLRAG